MFVCFWSNWCCHAHIRTCASACVALALPFVRFFSFRFDLKTFDLLTSSERYHRRLEGAHRFIGLKSGISLCRRRRMCVPLSSSDELKPQVATQWKRKNLRNEWNWRSNRMPVKRSARQWNQFHVKFRDENRLVQDCRETDSSNNKKSLLSAACLITFCHREVYAAGCDHKPHNVWYNYWMK